MSNIESAINEIVINGVTYVRKDSVSCKQVPTGTRAVVVIDRGWIYAGDVTETNGRIRLSRAVWIVKWSDIGFDGVIRDPKSKNVTLKRMENDVDLPAGAEVYRVPVCDNWGL